MRVLGAIVGDDRERALALLVLAEPDDAAAARSSDVALRAAGLEQLDHAGRPCVMSSPANTAGVERTHRELRARLTDRLRGHDADGLAEIGGGLRGEHRAVAVRGHGRDRLACERGAHTHAVWIVGSDAIWSSTTSST